MFETDERLDRVEQRLGSVETGLKEVRGEVGDLRTEVGGLRGEVGDLRGEVNELRILGEKNTDDIKKIAEVQGHHGEKLDEHGRKLDQIVRALEPLNDLRDFVRRVAPNHETRIQELEKRTGIQQ